LAAVQVIASGARRLLLLSGDTESRREGHLSSDTEPLIWHPGIEPVDSR
jgi:hypothetical protein